MHHFVSADMFLYMVSQKMTERSITQFGTDDNLQAPLTSTNNGGWHFSTQFSHKQQYRASSNFYT